MRRVILLAAATLATAGPAAPAREPVQRFPDQKVVTGFYQGRTLRYLDLGAVKLARGNTVAPIWAFTNGGGPKQHRRRGTG